jgi:hypothetical protein
METDDLSSQSGLKSDLESCPDFDVKGDKEQHVEHSAEGEEEINNSMEEPLHNIYEEMQGEE